VKSQAQNAGESDSFTTRNGSAPQSPASEHHDTLRSNSTKESATSLSPVDSAHHDHSLSGVVDAILEVGRQRKALLAQLRIALEAGNDGGALNLATFRCKMALHKLIPPARDGFCALILRSLPRLQFPSSALTTHAESGVRYRPMLIRLSAITPSPTQRLMPVSPW
jgi:hypothetical protein